jgi:catechol 2,3-dioxygenase-like lactoylglutathione lyase family enzyme
MKRLHVHVAVNDLQAGVRYYNILFGVEPTVLHEDYAKWALEDPAVNFAISARGAAAGVDHLGIQVDSEESLAELRTRLERAGQPAIAEEGARCCYAASEKTWSKDPSGVVWETFFTHGTIETFGKDAPDLRAVESEGACCGGGPADSDAC